LVPLNAGKLSSGLTSNGLSSSAQLHIVSWLFWFTALPSMSSCCFTYFDLTSLIVLTLTERCHWLTGVQKQSYYFSQSNLYLVRYSKTDCGCVALLSKWHTFWNWTQFVIKSTSSSCMSVVERTTLSVLRTIQRP
jgi:hypothetical protein